MHKSSGYTLLEILVVIGLLAIISSITLGLGTFNVNTKRVESIARDISSNAFLAQQNAFSGKDQLYYGIRFDTSSDHKYIIFETTGISDPPTYEKEVLLPYGIIFSDITLDDGGNEVLYNPGSFLPNTFGSITLNNGDVNYIIELNSEGLIDFYEIL